MKRIVIALLLFCGVAQADINLIVSGGKYYLVTKDAAGNPVLNQAVTVNIMNLDGVTPGPSPFPVPIPVGDLTATVKSATAAVPDYPDKATHRRAIAFGMSFLAQATANTPVPTARATVKQFCTAACGADAPKWSAWWSTVDAKLDSLSLTPATYTASLGEMAAAITADLPPGAADVPATFGGTPTYGLSPEFIKFLLEVLLPLLLKLLGL